MTVKNFGKMKVDTKEHIIKTAFLLFMKKSYKEVTLKDIIRETGLSNGAFYHYFESKEQLFKEVVDTNLFKVARQVWDYYPKDSLWNFIQDTLTDLEKIYSDLEDSMIINDGMNFFQFMFEAYRQFPDIQSEGLKLHKIEFASWVEILDIAKDKGEIKANLPTELIARMFIYLPDGAYTEFLVDKNVYKLQFSARKLWEGLYKILKT